MEQWLEWCRDVREAFRNRSSSQGGREGGADEGGMGLERRLDPHCKRNEDSSHLSDQSHADEVVLVTGDAVVDTCAASTARGGAAGGKMKMGQDEDGSSLVDCPRECAGGIYNTHGSASSNKGYNDNNDDDDVANKNNGGTGIHALGNDGGGMMYRKSSTLPPNRTSQEAFKKALEDPIFKDSSSVCPPFGSKSVMGRRAKMEDTFVAIPHLLDFAFVDSMNEIIPPRIASQFMNAANGTDMDSEKSGALCERGSSQKLPISMATAAMARGKCRRESLHLFGVFDGHGGADAAHHCKDTMHENIREVIMKSTLVETLIEEGEGCTGGLDGARGRDTPARGEHGKSTVDLSRVSTSSEVIVVGKTDDEDEKGNDEKGLMAAGCSSEAISSALAEAFRLTDETFAERGDEEQLSLVGTTAVVTLISSKSIYVANCGDSRAVLCRNGKAAALTDDHKAAREDETARVEAAGGQILFWNGVRVMGLLAVSRAIGDHSLRPYVIADPEVTVINRHPGDELLVLASDGLWDVMDNQEACSLAKKCLLRARQKGSSRENAARVAATVLTRAAVDRGSRDNVTVLVVDLMQDPDDLLEASALKMRLSGEVLMDQQETEPSNAKDQREKGETNGASMPQLQGDAESQGEDTNASIDSLPSGLAFRSPFEADES